MNSNDKLAELMAAATTLAEEEYFGLLTILKLSKGWKVAFGNFDLDNKGVGKDQVMLVPEFETLEEALENLLEERPDIEELYWFFHYQPLVDAKSHPSFDAQSYPSLDYLDMF